MRKPRWSTNWLDLHLMGINLTDLLRITQWGDLCATLTLYVSLLIMPAVVRQEVVGLIQSLIVSFKLFQVFGKQLGKSFKMNKNIYAFSPIPGNFL